MRPSPAPSAVHRARFAAAILAGGALFGTIVGQSFAHADDAILLPVVTTVVTPSTTATTTTSVPPVTVPPTTVAATAAPTTTVAPVTTTPTAVAVSIPTVTTTPTKKPTPKDPGNPKATGTTRVEVDISQQRLYIYKGSTLYRSIHVSTGSGKHYCTKGKCVPGCNP